LIYSKHQLVKQVTPGMKAAALKELFQQKENLDLLQCPYLTAVSITYIYAKGRGRETWNQCVKLQCVKRLGWINDDAHN